MSISATREAPTVNRLVIMYGLDLVILLLALAAAVFANAEWRQPALPRWRLLAPGVLASLGTLILLSYPDIRDLADLQTWMVPLLGLAIGAVRARWMSIECDQAFRIVRLRNAGDGAVAGWAMTLFAGIQGSIETALNAENPYEATAELLMLLASGYLLGRSLVAWLRARTGPHVDLHEA
jgi:hypothetical protein